MEAKNEGSDENVDEVMLPGFRFHPTDEELVGFYLKRKVQQRPLSIELIKQLDIYKFDPWDLPKIASGGEKEWYFFCPRDRKYRNSTRPNRVTGAGFWKATGTDRPIYSSEGNKCIGLKKSLVFYKGRAAKGVKTDWMMHEFRLPSLCETVPSKKCFDRRIPANDSWAICRIFKKTSPVTPRTPSNSWVSPSLREYNPSTRTLNSSSSNNNNTSNFSPQNTTNTSTSSSSYPGHANPHNYLQSPNNFSLLDHISSFMPIYPTTKDEIDNKPFFDQQLLGFPPMVDLPPSYILPQLEDPCETMSKSTIDISSMLLNNVPPSGNYNVNFDGVPSLTNGQCHDDDDFGHNLEDYQDFQSALMGNLNNMLHGGDEYDLRGVNNHNVGSFPIAELLPLVLPETWKSSSSTSLMWDCAPLL